MSISKTKVKNGYQSFNGHKDTFDDYHQPKYIKSLEDDNKFYSEMIVTLIYLLQKENKVVNVDNLLAKFNEISSLMPVQIKDFTEETINNIKKDLPADATAFKLKNVYYEDNYLEFSYQYQIPKTAKEILADEKREARKKQLAEKRKQAKIKKDLETAKKLAEKYPDIMRVFEADA